MFKSYRSKLIAGYLLLVTIILTLLGSIVYVQLKDFYLINIEQRLTKEAILVAEMAKYRRGDGNAVRSYQDICNFAAQDSEARVTIIDGNGVVLGDSSAQSETMESHANRPEFYKALHGQVGMEMRYSDTVQMNMLYVAVPFDNQEIEGAVRMAKPLAELQTIYHNVLAIIIIAAVICGVIAIILSFILARYFSRPIQDITEAVKDMANGHLKSRSAYHSADELGTLAMAFNEMGHSIEMNMNEIYAIKNRLEAVLNNTVNGIFMIGAQGRIAYANPVAVSLLNMGNDFIGRNYVEIINAYELLEVIDNGKSSKKPVHKNIVLYALGAKNIEVNVVPLKNDNYAFKDVLVVLNDITEIKRLEKVRKEFVANVSHELKTPVASISGFAETLLYDGGKSPANVAEFTRIIYDEAQRLSRLINRLLELSKLEYDEVKINIETINLAYLVRETAEIMRKTSKLRNISILYDEPSYFPSLDSDGDMIKQILMNIMDNAIKYSADGGQIEIKLEDLGDKVKISVRDSGIGIASNEIPRIFERFYRVDKARSRKTGGSGLGLAIVKHLAESLGGQVSVESTLGQGSIFSFIMSK